MEKLNSKWSDDSVSWTTRQTSAIKLYFESLAALCLAEAKDKGEDWAFDAIDALLRESLKGVFSHDREKDREAEARAVWSSRLAALAPILVRLRAKDNDAALSEIVTRLVEKAKKASDRKDVHYQARMELLYFNNAQAVARTHFLLASSPSSPLASEAKSLEAAWDEHLKAANNSLADQISLTWLTTAQLSFPLAFWLAGSP
jgi:hypothetical protein